MLLGTIFGTNRSGGSLTIPGAYSNDADAASNGVQIGKPYYILVSMDYGIPTGFVRIRES